jgi:uncharacterized membrane protein YhhN
LIPLIPVPFLVLTVALLIRTEAADASRQKVLWKACSTGLVILVCALAWTQPAHRSDYIMALLAGLLFSLGGDLALMVRSERAFLLGMALFFLTQLVYGTTFLFFGGWHVRQIPVGVVLLGIGVVFYTYLRPHLGKMRLPVGIYALVISLMVWMASGSLYSAAFSVTQRWLVVLGAFLFYVSDMVLAIDKFARPLKRRGLVILSTYYAGQLLIALSAAYAMP